MCWKEKHPCTVCTMSAHCVFCLRSNISPSSILRAFSSGRATDTRPPEPGRAFSTRLRIPLTLDRSALPRAKGLPSVGNSSASAVTSRSHASHLPANKLPNTLPSETRLETGVRVDIQGGSLTDATKGFPSYLTSSILLLERDEFRLGKNCKSRRK